MLLETDDDFHFEMFLAERLHKTRAEIRAMSCREFIDWGVYFGRKAQAAEMRQKRQ